MSPETPDFAKLARAFSADGPAAEDPNREERTALIADLLRQIWNARGDADVAQVNGSLLTGNVPKLVDAIRSLDR